MQGKRCKLSDEGRAEFTKNDRQGEIVGESNDRECWRLRWDGAKAIQSYHKSYITVLE